MINISVVGYGYWGPNIVRNLQQNPNFKVVSVCDKDPRALQRASAAWPSLEVTADVDSVLTSTKIDAVAIVTPVWAHFELAKAALENGKHILVEKPFTSSSEQALELIELAERKGLTIMVDHTFLFTGAVRKMHELVQSGILGNLYYYDSQRVNLGLLQHDVNVIWDLAPHDLSIMDYLIDGTPEAIVATGERHLNGHEDVAFITLYFPSRVIAHINVNWLSPVKVRTTLLGGEKKMLVWDDLAQDEKIKVYDKGVTMQDVEGVHKLLVSYRSGDMWAPRLESTEALATELSYFHDCITTGRRPINDGIAGWRIVSILEAAQESLRQRGHVVRVKETLCKPTDGAGRNNKIANIAGPHSSAGADGTLRGDSGWRILSA
jgi:predicted dehydrogenase